MPDVNEMDLVREFAERNSEPAFAEIVERHIRLVYSVALRWVGNAEDAQDVTQAVFIILAQKAGSLRQKTILTGWLYETTRFTALRFIRTRARRAHREQEAYMQSTLADADSESVWRQLSPLLEEAMTRLGEKERTLLALRFFENRSSAETALILGIEEAAARKRVTRAMEKLRRFFVKRGIVLSSAALGTAISAHSLQAAPAGLAKTATAVAMAKGATVSGPTLTLIKGALKLMAWSKAKMAIIAGVGLLLAAGTATIVVEEIGPSDVDDKWFQTQSAVLAKAPDHLRIIRPTHFGKPGMGSGMVGLPERIVSVNEPLEWGIVFAYNFSGMSWTRTALPEGFPRDHFDYLITFPRSANDFSQEEVRTAMQKIIKNKFGYIAHLETRERDVLVLQVKNPDAPGLHQPVQGTEAEGGAIQASVEGLNSKNFPMNWLAIELEGQLATPVFDETGLTNRVGLDLRWKKRPGESADDAIKRVVLDQLGLELVPDRRPIEMLAVEKVK